MQSEAHGAGFGCLEQIVGALLSIEPFAALEAEFLEVGVSGLLFEVWLREHDLPATAISVPCAFAV